MDLKDSKANPPNPPLSSLLPVSGSLRYIADRTRHDVLVAVGEISSDATPYPSDGHIKIPKRTLRYLKSTQITCFVQEKAALSRCLVLAMLLILPVVKVSLDMVELSTLVLTAVPSGP